MPCFLFVFILPFYWKRFQFCLEKQNRIFPKKNNGNRFIVGRPDLPSVLRQNFRRFHCEESDQIDLMSSSFQLHVELFRTVTVQQQNSVEF